MTLYFLTSCVLFYIFFLLVSSQSTNFLSPQHDSQSSSPLPNTKGLLEEFKKQLLPDGSIELSSYNPYNTEGLPKAVKSSDDLFFKSSIESTLHNAEHELGWKIGHGLKSNGRGYPNQDNFLIRLYNDNSYNNKHHENASGTFSRNSIGLFVLFDGNGVYGHEVSSVGITVSRRVADRYFSNLSFFPASHNTSESSTSVKTHSDITPEQVKAAIKNIYKEVAAEIFSVHIPQSGSTFSLAIWDYKRKKLYTGSTGDSIILIGNHSTQSVEIISSVHSMTEPLEQARVQQAMIDFQMIPVKHVVSSHYITVNYFIPSDNLIDSPSINDPLDLDSFSSLFDFNDTHHQYGLKELFHINNTILPSIFNNHSSSQLSDVLLDDIHTNDTTFLTATQPLHISELKSIQEHDPLQFSSDNTTSELSLLDTTGLSSTDVIEETSLSQSNTIVKDLIDSGLVDKLFIESSQPIPVYKNEMLSPNHTGVAELSYQTFVFDTPNNQTCFLHDLRLGPVQMSREQGLADDNDDLNGASFVRHDPEINEYDLSSTLFDYLLITSDGFTTPFENRAVQQVYTDRIVNCTSNCLENPMPHFNNWTINDDVFSIPYMSAISQLQNAAWDIAAKDIYTVIQKNILKTDSLMNAIQNSVDECHIIDETNCLTSSDDITVLYIERAT